MDNHVAVAAGLEDGRYRAAVAAGQNLGLAYAQLGVGAGAEKDLETACGVDFTGNSGTGLWLDHVVHKLLRSWIIVCRWEPGKYKLTKVS